jgi:hypothetical protein
LGFLLNIVIYSTVRVRFLKNQQHDFSVTSEDILPQLYLQVVIDDPAHLVLLT